MTSTIGRDEISFESLGLSKPALLSLARIGFEHPTPIQARAIPPAMLGRDVIGCAATGTGKSAAFALPMLERLAGKTGTRGLVLAPTRELAQQIVSQVAALGHSRGLHAATVIGGASMGAQIQMLRRKPAMIVATPGRLVDHLQRGTADLSAIEILVLDEADRMLDMGFRPQIQRILTRLPRERQTMLFSATLAGEVADFVRTIHLRDAIRVEISRSGTTAQRADQAVYFVEQDEKLALLLHLLDQESGSMLVFTRTKRRADRVAFVVERAGHATARIHADRSQGQRVQALEGFRSGRFRVLIATDIAARGLDIEEISHVVNFDVPYVAEAYVHRIGRTARADASGKASTFVAHEERNLLRDIERFTRQTISRRDVPRDSELFQREMAKTMRRSAHHSPNQPSAQGAAGRTTEPRRAPPERQGPRHRTFGKVSAGGGSGGWRPRRGR